MTNWKRLQLKDAIRAAIAAGVLGLPGMLPAVFAADIAAPTVPPPIQVPPGNTLYLLGHATGTQNYICETANVWTFVGPQATLFFTFGSFKQQIVTHFLSTNPNVLAPAPPACFNSPITPNVNCPTWQASFDSSVVWGTKAGSIDAGSDASCPNLGSIPCLLVQANGTQAGTSGPGLLTKTTYLQRLNTNGGSAPTISCNAGDQALVPYTADYYFYRAQQ